MPTEVHARLRGRRSGLQLAQRRSASRRSGTCLMQTRGTRNPSRIRSKRSLSALNPLCPSLPRHLAVDAQNPIREMLFLNFQPQLGGRFSGFLLNGAALLHHRASPFPPSSSSSTQAHVCFCSPPRAPPARNDDLDRERSRLARANYLEAISRVSARAPGCLARPLRQCHRWWWSRGGQAGAWGRMGVCVCVLGGYPSPALL